MGSSPTPGPAVKSLCWDYVKVCSAAIIQQVGAMGARCPTCGRDVSSNLTLATTLRGDWRWFQHGLITRTNEGSIPSLATKTKEKLEIMELILKAVMHEDKRGKFHVYAYLDDGHGNLTTIKSLHKTFKTEEESLKYKVELLDATMITEDLEDY